MGVDGAMAAGWMAKPLPVGGVDVVVALAGGEAGGFVCRRVQSTRRRGVQRCSQEMAKRRVGKVQFRTGNGVRGFRSYHSMTAAPQVRPAPKTIRRIRSPALTVPDSTASSRAIATEAAEVLPY